jgi:hypothetical protein
MPWIFLSPSLPCVSATLRPGPRGVNRGLRRESDRFDSRSHRCRPARSAIDGASELVDLTVVEEFTP